MITKRKTFWLLFILSFCLPTGVLTAQVNNDGNNVVYRGYNSKSAVSSNYLKEQWGVTVIDSTWNTPAGKENVTGKIISKYRPHVEALNATIGYSPRGLVKDYPESEMSNWAADAMFNIAQSYLDTSTFKGMKIDFSLLNFGGIRTSIPQGNVSSFDIMSIFPFKNSIVIEKLPGTKVKQTIELFATMHKVQIMGHTKLAITDDHVDEFLINGEPLDTNRVYNVATIDFLLNGGDQVTTLKNNGGVIYTNILMMDGIIDYIKNLTAQGKYIDARLDGRCTLKGSKIRRTKSGQIIKSKSPFLSNKETAEENKKMEDKNSRE
ncbi:MAG: 5'-nucleotidase [Bacteroidales bacterium]|nr:5'-nucleotidase [Bacteroidales bacterium]